MSVTKKALISSVIIMFLASVFFTVIDNQFAIELTAPIAMWLTFLLLASNLDRLGPYKRSCFFLCMGFMCLAMTDSLRFINHYILHQEPYSVLLRFMYVMPSFFYAINETIYLYLKLRDRKRDMLHLFVNTFCMSMIGFVVMYRIFYLHAGVIKNLLDFSYIFFIFICFYVCMMCMQTFYLVGRKNLWRGTNLITVALLVYEIMDIEYIFSEAIGEEPDSNIGDLVYLLCIIIIALGTTIQVHRKYTFDFRRINYTAESTRIRVIIAIAGVALSALTIPVGLLTTMELSNIIIILMAFIIMCYLLYTGEIRETQNELLEKMVKEKTSELADANSKLEMLSSTDALTKLYNRRFCDIYLNKLSMKVTSRFAVFCIDLNKFKPINDTYGHEMGDRVLEEFGKRMLALPKVYTSFRTGGDEFLIVLDRYAEETDLKAAAENLHELFRTPIRYESYLFNLSASIGIALYPEDSDNIDELMQYADATMYSIKRSGNKDGYRFFESKLTDLISLQQRLLKKLETAKPENDFVIYYQPQVDILTGNVIGFEVFPHLKGDMESVSPTDLIPAAEESGIMSALGIWLMKASLKQICEWNVKYGQHYSLTVNLSPLQLIDTEYFSAIYEVLSEMNVPTSSIFLDVANSVILGAASSAKESMKNLHENGFNLSLNDFGGDDINLSYILECGFTGIKLSRSLISGKNNKFYTKDLIYSIIQLAKSMHMNITAVGIETKEQEEHMKELGITTLQGYLYGRPDAAATIECTYLIPN